MTPEIVYYKEVATAVMAALSIVINLVGIGLIACWECADRQTK